MSNVTRLRHLLSLGQDVNKAVSDRQGDPRR